MCPYRAELVIRSGSPCLTARTETPPRACAYFFLNATQDKTPTLFPILKKHTPARQRGAVGKKSRNVKITLRAGGATSAWAGRTASWRTRCRCTRGQYLFPTTSCGGHTLGRRRGVLLRLTTHSASDSLSSVKPPALSLSLSIPLSLSLLLSRPALMSSLSPPTLLPSLVPVSPAAN